MPAKTKEIMSGVRKIITPIEWKKTTTFDSSFHRNEGHINEVVHPQG